MQARANCTLVVVRILLGLSRAIAIAEAARPRLWWLEWIERRLYHFEQELSRRCVHGSGIGLLALAGAMQKARQEDQLPDLGMDQV